MELSKKENDVVAVDSKFPSITAGYAISNEESEEAPVAYCNRPRNEDVHCHHHVHSLKKRKRLTKLCVNYMKKKVWINLPSKFAGKKIIIAIKANIFIRRISHLSRDYKVTKGSIQMSREQRASGDCSSTRKSPSLQRKMVITSNQETKLTAQNNLLM